MLCGQQRKSSAAKIIIDKTKNLNSKRLSSSFISPGVSSQILESRNIILSVPLKAVRAGGI